MDFFALSYSKSALGSVGSKIGQVQIINSSPKRASFFGLLGKKCDKQNKQENKLQTTCFFKDYFSKFHRIVFTDTVICVTLHFGMPSKENLEKAPKLFFFFFLSSF